MKNIIIKSGLLSTNEINFNKIVQSILYDSGFPLINSCCYNLNSKPLNGQSIIYNSTNNRFTVGTPVLPNHFLNNGDLLVGGAAGADTVLALGNDGDVLIVDYSVNPQRVKWGKLPANRYRKDILMGDWVIGATESTITILASVHLRGIDPIVQTFEFLGADYDKNTTGVLILPNGDVILSVTNSNRYSGKVIIL
jgi:hypothetical protein